VCAEYPIRVGQLTELLTVRILCLRYWGSARSQTNFKTYTFRKFHPVWIVLIVDNHRVILGDVWHPARARRSAVRASLTND